MTLVELSKIRINEIYNRIVVRNPERKNILLIILVDEKGKPSKSIKSLEKFKEVLKGISIEEHKNSLLNEKLTQINKTNDKKMKSTRSTMSTKWNNFRVDSHTENEIFKDFLNRYGFGRSQEYKGKLKFISQPFKFLSDRLSFDK